MVKRRRLVLTEPQRAELTQARDHSAHPYLRERSAARLQIAEGMSPYAVAQTGLLKRREADIVYGWLTSYETDGFAGITGRRHGGPRRGRV